MGIQFRYETILYRRSQTDNRANRDREPQPTFKKWYCRDYNKQEGCSKTSPHLAWFGTGPSAVRRQVIHACGACLIKDKVTKEHPEGHPACPHKD